MTAPFYTAIPRNQVSKKPVQHQMTFARRGSAVNVDRVSLRFG